MFTMKRISSNPLVSRFVVGLFAFALLLGTAGTTFAQDGGDPPSNGTSTDNAITDTMDTLGLDVSALISNFVGTVGESYKTMLILGFVLATGWIAYGHYKKGATKK